MILKRTSLAPKEKIANDLKSSRVMFGQILMNFDINA